MEEACTAAAGSASRNPTCKRPDVKDLMQHCRAVCNALTFKVFMQGPSVHMVMLALCRCHSSYSRLSGIFTHIVCTVTSSIPGQLDHDTVTTHILSYSYWTAVICTLQAAQQ